jgi:Spy/CpxP family protein refolding chaperone
MWERIKNPLLALSLGLNLAFAAVWLSQAFFDWTARHRTADTDHAQISSRIHREIGVTPEQWKILEPVISSFQKQAQQQRREVLSLRNQLMDLLVVPEPDHAAIQEIKEEILAAQRQMQDLVIGHLLREKALLSPDQAHKLIQSLCEQCRHDSGMGSGKGIGKMLEKRLGDE